MYRRLEYNGNINANFCRNTFKQLSTGGKKYQGEFKWSGLWRENKTALDHDPTLTLSYIIQYGKPQECQG
jgi:hypothetical protein